MDSDSKPGDFAEGQEPVSDTPKIGGLDAEGWAKRAEEIFKSMPPPAIQRLPKKDAFDLSKYKNQLDCTTAEAWQKCAEIIENYDAATCQAHREEIDTLLLFAGLFSAVVTAFTIESYQWLQNDPNDAVIALLTQIARAEDQNGSVPAPEGLPDAVSVRINTYWFLSLILSLAAALVAILCKQWVREFERHGEQSHRRFISIRQTKLEGFERWGVATIVATIPLILQIALGLFTLGVIELLWKLHTMVAIVVLIPTAAALVFYTATSLLPTIQVVCSPFGALRSISQCPFKSPQALLSLRLYVLLRESWYHLCVNVVLRPVESCHKKWLVFSRRVRAVFRPETVPGWNSVAPISRNDVLDGPTDADGPTPPEEPFYGLFSGFRRFFRNIWRRGLRPWQSNESVFFDEDMYVLTPRIWRKFYPRRIEWSIYPKPTRSSSWLSLDMQFTDCRDSAFSQSNEYARGGLRVPPAAFFRGLLWLRDQTYHQGLQQWTWQVAWDISRRVENTKLEPLVRHGVRHLIPFPSERRVRGQEGEHYLDDWLEDHKAYVYWTPAEFALAYALYARIDDPVMGEFFLHLRDLNEEVTAALWYLAREQDVDVWHSGLHVMLARWVRAGPGEKHAVELPPPSDYQSYLSWQQLACTIALSFRDQPSEQGDLNGNLKRLLEATLACLTTDPGKLELLDPVLKSTFSALAVAFDQFLERQERAYQLQNLPNKLHDNTGRSVYFDLLSYASGTTGSPSGGVTAAKGRLKPLLSHMWSLLRFGDMSTLSDLSDLAEVRAAWDYRAWRSTRVGVTPYHDRTAPRSSLGLGDLDAAAAVASGDAALVSGMSAAHGDDGTRSRAGLDAQDFSEISDASSDAEDAGILEAHGGDAISSPENQRVQYLHSLGVSAVAPCDAHSRTSTSAAEPGSDAIGEPVAQEPVIPTAVALAHRDAEPGLRARGEHDETEMDAQSVRADLALGDSSADGVAEPGPGTELVEIGGELSTRSQAEPDGLEPDAAAVSPET